jgi:hypothetical protein
VVLKEGVAFDFADLPFLHPPIRIIVSSSATRLLEYDSEVPGL